MKTKLTPAAPGLPRALAGCKSIDPRQVAGDRSDSGDAIGFSWKGRTLLNIVKPGHMDPPIFVDADWIVAGDEARHGWTRSPAGKILMDYRASLMKYPPIPPGAPGPYTPPAAI